jgi:hypothetical protein
MSDATSSFGHYNPFIMALIEVGPAVESFEDIDINSLSQVIANDRLGRNIAAQTGTDYTKIQLKKW